MFTAKKTAGLLLISCFWQFLARPLMAADSPRIIPSQKIANQSEFAPNQILVKFKKEPRINFESEISLKIPLTNQKLVLRRAGWKVKNHPEATKISKDLGIKTMAVVGTRGETKKTVLMGLAQEANLNQAITRFAQDKDVAFAEPNYLARALWQPNDPYLSSDPINHFQWNLARINIPQAWEFSPRGGSQAVKVAVIDTGVAFENYHNGQSQFYLAPELDQVNFVSPLHLNSTHSCAPDCAECVWRSQPVADLHPNDDDAHGTHLAATIAQKTDNQTHAAGIAFNVSLMPIKILNWCGLGLYSDIAAGVNHAVDQGAKVINLSLGGDQTSQILTEAIQNAHQAGVVVVAASGNEATRSSSPAVTFPASLSQTIAVGASRWDNARASYSNFGPELDLIAPGGQMTIDGPTDYTDWILDANGDLLPDGIVQQTFKKPDFTAFTEVLEPVLVDGSAGKIYFRCLAQNSTDVWIDDAGCGLFQGTSFAVSHVSAVAALILSLNPALSPNEVKNILVESASSQAIPDYLPGEHGAGLLDAAAALSLAAPSPTASPTPTTSDTPTPRPSSTITPTATPSTPPSPTATPVFKKGDANHDTRVDCQDALLVLSYFGKSWPDTVWPDTNQDGLVNLDDFSWIIHDWQL